MASIVSSLGDEKELRMQGLFDQPVRFHLLYKCSHHGADISTLLSKFDESGKFVLAVFLQSGVVRGGFTSKSLKAGKEFADAEAFLFEVERNAKRFRVLSSASAVQVHFPDSGQSALAAVGSVFGAPSYSLPSARGGGFHFGVSAVQTQPASPPSPVAVSFGKALHIYSNDSKLYVNFCKDLTYSCGWAEEQSVRCVDVELHRVQDVGDVLPNPWREMDWYNETRRSLREKFVSYKLVVKTVSQARALLLGPVGSGKSSLINSIKSTMLRRVIHLPNVSTTTGSFTKKLKSYEIREEKGGPLTALTLCDVMAIEDEDFTGLSLSDILAVIKGHTPEGYQFQSDDKLNDKFTSSSTLKDQVHGVLFVLDASKVASYSVSQRNILRKLHTTLSDMDAESSRDGGIATVLCVASEELRFPAVSGLQH
ncbi:uncharacterized protein [Salminus brasiliensis]|uniref:uncharacterized protein isoform X2 n=1 Tax=Salminus brasiliensis TaxID=930266 RepID=UPI003B8360DB